MKTTIIANINGVAFQMDEDAYILLEKYLKNLAIKFGNSQEGQETVSDIEGRIAELFSHTHKTEGQSIAYNEVAAVIKTIGEVDDFEGQKSTQQKETQPKDAPRRAPQQKAPTSKRLFRDVDNRIIGGVCSGLGAYFEIDPLLIRLIAVISLLVGLPFIFLGYIVLWIVIKPARTFAQKIEMLGNINEPLDVQGEMAYQRRYKTTDSWFTAGVRKVLGIVIILLGISLSIGAFGVLISAFAMEAIATHVQFAPIMGALDFFSSNIFGSTSLFVILLGVFLWFITPAILLIYGGVKLIKTTPYKIPFLVPICVILWILGWAMVISSGVGIIKEFDKKSSVTNNILINPTTSVNIYLKANAVESIDDTIHNWSSRFPQCSIKFPHKNFKAGLPTIWLERGDSLKVVIKRMSKGKDTFAAINNAKMTVLNVTQNDSVINMDPQFIIPKPAKYRSQEVEVVITVPEGKQLIIDEKLQNLVQNKLY